MKGDRDAHNRSRRLWAGCSRWFRELKNCTSQGGCNNAQQSLDAVATEEQAYGVRLINAATAATAATATTDLDVERAREKSDGSFGAEEILEI